MNFKFKQAILPVLRLFQEDPPEAAARIGDVALVPRDNVDVQVQDRPTGCKAVVAGAHGLEAEDFRVARTSFNEYTNAGIATMIMNNTMIAYSEESGR